MSTDQRTPAETFRYPGPSLGIPAGLLAAGRTDPQVDPHETAVLRRLIAERTPELVRLSGSTTAPASGVGWINLGGPQPGTSWDVRRVNVGPGDYTGTLGTGITVFAVLGAGTTPPVVNGMNVISMTAAWPAEATWSRDQLSLEPGDVLWVGVSGLSSGAAITAGGQALAIASAVQERYTLA